MVPQLFVFQFAHEADVKRVLEGGPLAYENHLLLLQRILPGGDPVNVVLNHVNLWVQVHNLPLGFMLELVAQHIGKKLGGFVEADPNNYNNTWRSFMRVRVSFDVTKPLKKSLNIKQQGGDWKEVLLRYGRLPTFCFSCGKIGHGEKLCSHQFENDLGVVECVFGPELRAIPRKSAQLSLGLKWLQDTPFMVAGDGGSTDAGATHLEGKANNSGDGERDPKKSCQRDTRIPAKVSVQSEGSGHGKNVDFNTDGNVGTVKGKSIAKNEESTNDDDVVFTYPKRKRLGFESEA